MQAQSLEKSKHNSKAEQLRKEFNEKNAILRKHGEEVSASQYYDDLYGKDGNETMPYTLSDASKEEKAEIQRAQNIDEILQIAIFRKDIYTYPCTFFYSWPRENLLRDIHALIIDLDNVSPIDLEGLAKNELQKFMPTYMVNSGQGVHLVYVFESPITAYQYKIKPLKSILKALKKVFKIKMYSYNVDPAATIVHPYRVVGSQTKLGQKATAYKVGAKWEISEMAKLLHIDSAVFEEKKRTSAGRKVRQRRNVKAMPCCSVNFYNSTYNRIRREVDEGHRYLSLFALAIIAYKCRVKEEVLLDHLTQLVDAFNQKEQVKKVRESEIAKAMCGYNQKFVTVTSFTLEEYLGFEFKRNTKRNGLKRNEHLQMARAVMSVKQKTTREMQMRRCLTANPNASLKQLMEKLGWGKATVVKYKKLVQGV